jgi:hypothetical protein
MRNFFKLRNFTANDPSSPLLQSGQSLKATHSHSSPGTAPSPKIARKLPKDLTHGGDTQSFLTKRHVAHNRPFCATTSRLCATNLWLCAHLGPSTLKCRARVAGAGPKGSPAEWQRRAARSLDGSRRGSRTRQSSGVVLTA